MVFFLLNISMFWKFSTINTYYSYNLGGKKQTTLINIFNNTNKDYGIIWKVWIYIYDYNYFKERKVMHKKRVVGNITKWW